MKFPRVAETARGLSLFLLLAGTAALAQEPRVLQLEDGEKLEYTLRSYAADAHRAEASVADPQADVLEVAKRVTRHLAAGELEEVSLLSNAPKARFERLRESFAGWTKDEFARAFGRYFDADNRIVGDAAIGRHRLLMWYLKDTDYITAYYFVEVEGKFLLDDVPGETRARLRQVLEAHRSGRAPLSAAQR